MEKMVLRYQSIGHLLEKAVAQNVARPFFIFEGKRLSYAEVNRRVNKVANSLKGLGVKKGKKVGLMLPNGLEFPITWLAIAKLGAVMVPINIKYQEHDLLYVINDSEASYLVIHQDFLPILEKVKRKATELMEVCVVGKAPSGFISFDEMERNASDLFTIETVGEEDLVNIQYTSGTTGFSKGCMLTHRYCMLLGKLIHDIAGLMPDDVAMTAQPFYYMDPQWNVIMCMFAGIPLVIMPRFSVSNFWATVKENNVTFFYLLGTMPLYLLSRNADELEKNHRVRAVVCSGIIPKFHEILEKRFNCPWREAFGMTETGVDLYVPFEDIECVASGSMGSPVPTKEVRVVDNGNNEVSNGEIGELVIRGEPMMLGYWKKPEANEEIFRGGWLHTGDLAYKDKKGHFHWVGRIKDMVRRSAENISAAEVESVLALHEKVKLVAVVPVPDYLHGEEVKAYLILKEGENKETVPPREIIEFAKTKLAAFKVPRYIEYVYDLPRTPSEKVEKHKVLKAKDDLRLDSYDVERGIWITELVLEEIKKEEKS